MQNFEVDFMDFNYLAFPQFTTVQGAYEQWAEGELSAGRVWG